VSFFGAEVTEPRRRRHQAGENGERVSLSPADTARGSGGAS